MAPDPRKLRYEGIHCDLRIEQPASRVIVLRISGTDIGEFGEAPFQSLTSLLATDPIELFIDARDVRGASIEVSSDWAAWLNTNKDSLRSVTMLTGSRFIQITAEFVRRFASLEGIMRICTEPDVFDWALAEALKSG